VSDELLAALIVVAIMLLVGFPVHEFSHALAAYRLGDSTARFMGRLSSRSSVIGREECGESVAGA